MKKLTWTSLFVSAAMLFTVGTGFASAEGSGTGHVDPEYTITIPYDYPVRPGTPEWAEFTDHQQMIDACEIPESILHSMTTEALVDTVLDYPLFINIYLSDTTTSNGYENAKEVFNGLTELANRPDAASILLDKYQKSDVITPNAYRSIPDVNKIFFDISNLIEYII